MADYRLTQTGEQVQEALNQVPVNTEGIQTLGNEKVDKVTGKGLSQNDYTNADKTKLDALPTRQELTAEEALKADKSDTYTKAQVDSALGGKQDTIGDLATIRPSKSVLPMLIWNSVSPVNATFSCSQ